MNNLQQKRQELGLTQQQVAKAIRKADSRMDVSMVSRFERGACLPTAAVLEALEEVLQASRAELYGADELAAMPEETTAESANLSQTAALIGRVIPFGAANAIKRQALAVALGTTDREARKQVEKARAEGLIIINRGDGRGYYQTTDLDEIAQQYGLDTSRAMAILKRRKTMRRMLKAAGRQV